MLTEMETGQFVTVRIKNFHREGGSSQGNNIDTMEANYHIPVCFSKLIFNDKILVNFQTLVA